ncbi:MAG: hypothetical protein V3V61_04745 [Gammaproteobacteria bacterium]
MSSLIECERQQAREQVRQQIAKNLLVRKHLPIEEIASLTGLDPGTIRNLDTSKNDEDE